MGDEGDYQQEERRDRSRSPPRDNGAANGGGGDAGGKSTGVACRWQPGGFGFIKPDDGSEDVFCHASSITDGDMLQDGARVTYERVYDDRKGKYRAENVTGGTSEVRREPGSGGGRTFDQPPAEGRVRGTACRWNERGFGFVKPDDGSEDVFCHCSSIKDGNALREGDKVEYTRVYDDRKGKYRAEDVEGGIQEADRGGFGGGGYGGGGGGYGGGGGGYGGGGGGYGGGGYSGGGGYGGGGGGYSGGGGYGGGGGGYDGGYGGGGGGGGYDDRGRGGYDDRRGGGYDDRRGGGGYDDRGRY